MEAILRHFVRPQPAAATAANQMNAASIQLVDSPYSYELPLVPVHRHKDQKAPRPPMPRSAASANKKPCSVAHWDNKRQKCRNCHLIYLKTTSLHEGFCSVDCKSNAAYLDRVNRTIRAVKEAVEQVQKQQGEEEEEAQQQPVQEQEQAQEPEQQHLGTSQPIAIGASHHGVARARSFAEFGIESRMVDDNIEWAFSAMY